MGSFDLPVSLRVRGSLDEVWAAWTDRSIAVKWMCDAIEGEWRDGGKVVWVYGQDRQEIRVKSVTPKKSVTFFWNAYSSQMETEVTIEFRELGAEVGLVLRERQWDLTHDNVKIALDHACGWENLFCRLKAWTEAKVILR